MNRPTIKDKSVLAYVESLERELRVFQNSPVVKSYLTILNQINDWNEQLEIKDAVTIIDPDGIKVKMQPGKIDLFSDKDDKSFDRAFKYFGDVLPLHKTLKELRTLMTESQKDKVDSNNVKENNLLERLVFDNKGK